MIYLKVSMFSIILFLVFPKTSLASCQDWESGKYKAENNDSEAIDDAVREAFNLKDPHGSVVSFNKCIFTVRPQSGAKILTFDYSKNKEKCSSIKTIFEMNLIGCEQTINTYVIPKRQDSAR